MQYTKLNVMNKFLLSVLVLFCFSCIPLSIAPEIESHKLVKAKKFKRDLPKNFGFVFEDPKEADEFYNFINEKYDLGFIDVESSASFRIDGANYSLSFYEREKVTQTLNLIPIALDVGLTSDGGCLVLDDLYTSRLRQNWYLILTVSNDETEDCLHPDYKNSAKVIEYLRNLKEEYLATKNYIGVYLFP